MVDVESRMVVELMVVVESKLMVGVDDAGDGEL